MALGIALLAFWLGVLCGALLLAALIGRPGRDLRRGGYIKPPASTDTRSASQLYLTRLPGRSYGVTETILHHVEDSSSYGGPGPVSAAWAIPRLRREPSRLTGRGWSTVGTAGAGGNGRRLRSVT